MCQVVIRFRREPWVLLAAVGWILLVDNPYALATPIDPASLTGRVLHLDAGTLGLVNNAAVNTWTDLSPAANSMTANGAPTFIQNGGAAFNNLPVVRFNGATEMLDSTFGGLTNRPGSTVFAVLNTTDATGLNQVALSAGSGDGSVTSFPRIQKFTTDGAHRWLTGGFNGPYAVGEGTVVVTGQRELYQSVFDGTQPFASRLDITVGGVRHGTGTGPFGAGVPGTTTGTPTLMRLGDWHNTGFNWQGDIAEVIVFDRTLTPAEQHGVSQFLSQKYGFAAPEPIGQQLISLDFNVNSVSKVGNDPGGFAGQTGVWNSLNVGEFESGARTGPLGTADGSRTNNAVTFAITSGTYRAGDGGGDTLRGDVLYLQTGVNTAPLSWEINGLVPGLEYDLAFFGQQNSGGSNINDANFAVTGYGQILTDNVAIFSDVIANAQGQITGQMLHDAGDDFSSWSGLQIRGVFATSAAVPESDSIALWSLIGLGLVAFGYSRLPRKK